MADTVLIGAAPNDNTGDRLRIAFNKINVKLEAMQAGYNAEAQDIITRVENAHDGAVDAQTEAEAAQAAAEAAEFAAQQQAAAALASAGTAAANAKNYANTAAALADATLIVGSQFSVVNGVDIDFYRKDAGPVATYLYSVASAGYVSGQIGSRQIGYAQAASGLSSGSAIYYWPLTVSAFAQRLKTIEASAPGQGQATLVVAFVEGDGSLTMVSTRPVPLRAGLNVISDLDIAVPPGCVVGMGGTPMYYEAVATSIWFTGAVPTASTAKTITTSNPVRLRFVLEGQTKRQADIAAEKASALGQIELRGWSSPIVSTGTTVPGNYTIFDPLPVEEDGFLSSVRVGAATGASSTLLVASITSAGVVTLLNSVPLTLVAGVNDYPVRIAVAAGNFVGISTGFRYQPFSNPDGIKPWLKSGTVTNGETLSANGNHRYEVQFTLRSGVLAELEALSTSQAGNSGLAGMASADATGVADATAILAAARSAHPQPYIPPGLFSVTSIPSDGVGLWGPGRLSVNGTRYYVNSQPKQTTLLTAMRAALQQHITAGDVLTLVGDSISHFSAAGTGPAHWFNRLTRFANLGIAADEPLMSALRPSSTYTPDFYGVSYTGTVTTGTAGPIGESAILAAGAVLTFTGSFETVGVHYTQGAGAGSMAFQFNGGAAFGTTSAAGAAELDRYVGHTTGQTLSGTYTITVSGGPVEITGLVRLGVKTAGTPPRLRTARHSHGSYTFGSFNAAARAAIVKQCTYAGGKAVPIIALGINDSFTTPAATIVANATALIDAFVAAGVERMYALPPIRPSSAWDASYTGGRVYDDAAGPLRKLYRDRGVQVIPVDALDWVALGELADGLHPGPVAQDRIAQIFAEGVAA